MPPVIPIPLLMLAQAVDAFVQRQDEGLANQCSCNTRLDCRCDLSAGGGFLQDRGVVQIVETDRAGLTIDFCANKPGFDKCRIRRIAHLPFRIG